MLASTPRHGRARRTRLVSVIVVAASIAIAAASVTPIVVERLQAEREAAEQAQEAADLADASASAEAEQQRAEDERQARRAEDESELESELRTLMASSSGRYSITVHEITGDQRALSIDGALQKEPASTIKVFIAWAVLHLVDSGELTLDTRVYDGSTVDSCLDAMIEESDNDCSAYLRVLIGNERINALWDEAGYENTEVLLDSSGDYDGKTTTTDDLASLLVSLQAGTALSEDSTALLLDHMRDEIWTERIPAGLPAGIDVASKPGWLMIDTGMTESDAAIVWGASSTYVLTVLGDEGATESEIAEISRAVYAALND